MNPKALVLGIIVIAILISASIFTYLENENSQNSLDRNDALKLLENITPINISQQGTGEIIFTTGNSIFETFVYSGGCYCK